MKNILIFSLLVFGYTFSFGQINTELIKKNVTDNPQENFYRLLEVFKSNPNDLNQDEMNQIYYGSKFVKLDYTIGDYNRESGKFWKTAQKKLSKSKAEKLKEQAEFKYGKNPLNKNLLDDMINIYSALNDEEKVNLCLAQKKLITQTIENSGDGKSEETAICVLTAGEVLQNLEILIQSGPREEFTQKMKQLSDDSVLTIYQIGDRKIFVKLVGGYF